MRQSRVKLGAAVIATALVAFTAGAFAQPRYAEIDRAEAALQAALGDLRAARDVFGGHKAAAERLINEALGELQAGKADATAHGR